MRVARLTMLRLLLPVLQLCVWVLAVASPSGVCGQQVVASLQLDRREPRPIWFEYVRADKGLLTISYLSRYSSRSLGIFKYDSLFRPQWQLPLYDQTDGRKLEHMAVLGNYVYVFYSERSAREKLFKVFCSIFDLTGKEVRRGLPVLTVNLADSKGDPSKLHFTRSLNRRKLLIWHAFQEGNTNQRLAFRIFDRDSVARHTGMAVTLPYEDEALVIKSIKVSNQGRVYTLARHNLNPKPRLPKDVRYLVFAHDLVGKRTHEMLLDIPDKYVTELSFKPDRDESLAFAGFYSNKAAGHMIGSFSGRLTEWQDTFRMLQYQPFPPDVLSRFLTTRQIEKGRELTDFYFDDFVLRSDGGMLLLSEQYYTTLSTYRDVYGAMFSREIHHYDDILMVSLSAAGTLEWATAVYKDQASEFQEELPYLPLIGENRLFLLYKSRLKGLGLNVYANEVRYGGEVSPPKPFFERFAPSDVFYREFSEQVTNSEAIIAVYQSQSKSFSLLKLAF